MDGVNHTCSSNAPSESFFQKEPSRVCMITGQIQDIVYQNWAHKPNQESATEVPVVEKVEQLANFKVRGVSMQGRPLHTEGGDRTLLSENCVKLMIVIASLPCFRQRGVLLHILLQRL